MRRHKRIAIGVFALGAGAVLLAPSASILYYAYGAQRRYRIFLDDRWLTQSLAAMAILGTILVIAGIYLVISGRSRSRRRRSQHVEPDYYVESDHDARPKAEKRIVTVKGEPHEVRVYRKSKRLWLAIGKYMGRLIQAQGHSRSSALKRWDEAVQESASAD